MHWVDRGSEPEDLANTQSRYTRNWVDHYTHGNPKKPSDSYWRNFHKDLRDSFCCLCGYCEAFCKGSVDHFRPKSKYPELVYEWSNWIFSCTDCNNNKLAKWPPDGFVDPCAKSSAAKPENYFTFDLLTGEIIPRERLTERRLKKAKNTISELGLNAYYQLKRRREWLSMLSLMYDNLSKLPEEDSEIIRTRLVALCSRDMRLSSLTREFMNQEMPDIDH